MATRFFYFHGKAKWAKVRKPDEKYGNYTINLYPTPESRNLIAESGLQIAPKNDDEGEFFTFRRPHEKLIKKEVVEFGPPQALNPDGTEFDGLIGNGSDVTIKVSVYDTIKGKGHRWESVRVDKLVVYEGTGAGAGMPDMPPSAVAAAAAKPRASSAIKPPF